MTSARYTSRSDTNDVWYDSIREFSLIAETYKTLNPFFINSFATAYIR